MNVCYCTDLSLVPVAGFYETDGRRVLADKPVHAKGDGWEYGWVMPSVGRIVPLEIDATGRTSIES